MAESATIEPTSTTSAATSALTSSPTQTSDSSNAVPVPTSTSSRKRRRSNESPTYTASSGLKKPGLPSSRKVGLFNKFSSKPLTAAAEMEDEKRQREEKERAESRQQSPNPARKAVTALLGNQENVMSKPQDAPNAANTISQPLASVADSIAVSGSIQGDTSMHTSPVSLSSLGTFASGAGTVTTNGARVASPSPINDGEGDDEGNQPSSSNHHEDRGSESNEGLSNKALTFPGPLLSAQVSDARRGMSLPHSGSRRDSSKSPSRNKKHKCPYCSTDFTRHHNLKSHLLTHSHEKPYMCQTCDARFRRLHDLKRHTKLHTGERPHVCPKCKRSFARGDALARHNKGQGGCAGRRSSMGSYGADDDGGDNSMHGMMYTGEASHEPEHMDEDGEDRDQRLQSLPSIRRHDAPPDSHHRHDVENQSSYHSRQPSTYPPVAVRQANMGGLQPPTTGYGGGSSTATSPRIQAGSLNQYPPASNGSSSYQTGSQNLFAQGGMTESPKPLSPSGSAPRPLGHPESGIHRNRSPSLTQQFQQQQYGRRPNTRGTTPPMGLPPPVHGSSHSTAPSLPSLPSLHPPDSRYTLQSQASGTVPAAAIPQGNQHGPSHPSGGATPSSFHSHQGGRSSHSDSHSSHGTQPHTSGEGGNLPYPQGFDRVWVIIRDLEQKVERLQNEVSSLRSQIPAQNQSQNQASVPIPPGHR
ncbi:hypothetical protein MMC20_002903 [Loxospora ochrophaea]|nr:hypothetical protein [Loxospora ochrophaea]